MGLLSDGSPQGARGAGAEPRAEGEIGGSNLSEGSYQKESSPIPSWRHIRKRVKQEKRMHVFPVSSGRLETPPFGSHPSCGHKTMWSNAGSKYSRSVGTQPKIASPSAETQQHGAIGLQLSAQGPRKCLTFSGVGRPPRRTYPGCGPFMENGDSPHLQSQKQTLRTASRVEQA